MDSASKNGKNRLGRVKQKSMASAKNSEKARCQAFYGHVQYSTVLCVYSLLSHFHNRSHGKIGSLSHSKASGNRVALPSLINPDTEIFTRTSFFRCRGNFTVRRPVAYGNLGLSVTSEGLNAESTTLRLREGRKEKVAGSVRTRHRNRQWIPLPVSSQLQHFFFFFLLQNDRPAKFFT